MKKPAPEFSVLYKGENMEEHIAILMAGLSGYKEIDGSSGCMDIYRRMKNTEPD